MENLALGFLVICALIHSGGTIMCYECNSAINSFCNAKVLPDNLKRNCSEHDRGIAHTLCRKIVQQVEHEINGQTPMSRVIRTCGWDESKYKGVCYHRSGYGGKQEVCSCSTNLCNGTASRAATVHLIIIPLIMMTVRKQLCNDDDYNIDK